MALTLGPQLWIDWFGTDSEPGPEVVSPVEDDPLGRPSGGIADVVVPEIPRVPRGHWEPDELPALA